MEIVKSRFSDDDEEESINYDSEKMNSPLGKSTNLNSNVKSSQENPKVVFKSFTNMLSLLK